MAKILYFAALVDKLGRASETLELPVDVRDVHSLLTWLRSRGGDWERELAEDVVTVTVNKQFAVPDTNIDNEAEIAIVSKRPW